VVLFGSSGVWRCYAVGCSTHYMPLNRLHTYIYVRPKKTALPNSARLFGFSCGAAWLCTRWLPIPATTRSMRGPNFFHVNVFQRSLHYCDGMI
jgi:hypothetical protein